MSNRLLPSGSSALELAAAEACAELARVDVPLKTLWDPQTCRQNFCPIWHGHFLSIAGTANGQQRQNAA